MRYSRESVELAVDLILPNIKTAKEMGASFHLPQTMKDAAEQYLLKGHDSFSKEGLICLEVIKEGLNELYSKGHIEYGDKELSDELSACNKM